MNVWEGFSCLIDRSLFYVLISTCLFHFSLSWALPLSPSLVFIGYSSFQYGKERKNKTHGLKSYQIHILISYKIFNKKAIEVVEHLTFVSLNLCVTLVVFVQHIEEKGWTRDFDNVVTADFHTGSVWVKSLNSPPLYSWVICVKGD